MKKLLLTLCLPLGFGCSQMLTGMNSDTTQKNQNNSVQLANGERAVAAPMTDNQVYQSGLGNILIIQNRARHHVKTLIIMCVA